MSGWCVICCFCIGAGFLVVCAGRGVADAPGVQIQGQVTSGGSGLSGVAVVIYRKSWTHATAGDYAGVYWLTTDGSGNWGPVGMFSGDVVRFRYEKAGYDWANGYATLSSSNPQQFNQVMVGSGGGMTFEQGRDLQEYSWRAELWRTYAQSWLRGLFVFGVAQTMLLTALVVRSWLS